MVEWINVDREYLWYAIRLTREVSQLKRAEGKVILDLNYILMYAVQMYEFNFEAVTAIQVAQSLLPVPHIRFSVQLYLLPFSLFQNFYIIVIRHLQR